MATQISSSSPGEPPPLPQSRAPAWLERAGTQAWLFIGIVLAAAVLAVVLAALSGIVVPLIVAVIIGMLCRPLVDWARRHRVPAGVAALATMLLIIASTVVMAVVVINGLVQQLPKLLSQAGAGLDDLGSWIGGLGLGKLDPSVADAARAAVTKVIPIIGKGLTGLVSTSFSGVAAFAVGTFFALFALYYVLKDGPRFDGWLQGHSRAAHDLFDDAGQSLRGYFKGTAVSALISSAVVLVGLLIAGTPLVVPILVLYFVTSFIPYIGAYVGGAYTVLIAFSAGGPQAALIVGIGVLISNGTLQNVITSWAVGATLNLHPLVILVATAIGGSIAGILGMILAAPITAIIVHTVQRLRAAPPGSAAPVAA